jgi:hypothetical protein
MLSLQILILRAIEGFGVVVKPWVRIDEVLVTNPGLNTVYSE